MGLGKIGSVLTAGLLALALPAQAQQIQSVAQTVGEQVVGGAAATEYESLFDSMLGTEVRPLEPMEATYDSDLTRRIARLADASQGRIGVYAIDLSSGEEVGVMADQWFPLASTSKVAIAATYLAGVDQGKWTLSSEWRLPGRGGATLPARRHLELMISKSCNDCTDALLNAVGGPAAVTRWLREAGRTEFMLTRDIATRIREDGRSDPATSIDVNDSATPRAMGQLLAGIYQGKWLSSSSRSVLMSAMFATTTGKNRRSAALPGSANLAHKTGTLSRTASDIGLFQTADGRTIAAAIYVTGQSPSMAYENGDRGAKLEARRKRDLRINSITGALYEGFQRNGSDGRGWANATYGGE